MTGGTGHGARAMLPSLTILAALVALGCTEPQQGGPADWGSLVDLDSGDADTGRGVATLSDRPALPRDTGEPVDPVCAGNLLTDGGFELDRLVDAGWVEQGDVPFYAGLVPDMVVSGAQSALLTTEHDGEVALIQTVPVQPGVVYEYTGWLALDGVSPLGPAGLWVSFSAEDGQLLSSSELPDHSQSREFGLDFPSRLKLRAPDDAATASVRLQLGGAGSLWVDDVCFRPAPVGDFTGVVHADGEPLPGARVHLVFEHWGESYRTFTDDHGRYLLPDVPVALPRYVLVASKPGYRSRSQGHLHPVPGEPVEVDFELTTGKDPTDVVELRFVTLDVYQRDGLTRIHKYAEIPQDPGDYPESVQVHLGSGAFLDTTEPSVQALAAEILASLPERDRRNTREVAWAVYVWLAKHIEYESLYTDPTGPMLETAWADYTTSILSSSPDGWGWGRSINDSYLEPEELLNHRSGICAEIASLAVVLLRNMGVPARTSQGTMELWYQLADGSEAGWVELRPSHARASWRRTGSLGSGFELTRIAIASVHADPVQQATWSSDNGGFWRESHPWEVYWPYDTDGLREAEYALLQMADDGFTFDAGGPPCAQGICYRANYRLMKFQLMDFVEQQELTLSFPFSTASEYFQSTGDYAYWINLPETVKGVEITKDFDPTGETTIKQVHITLDLSSVL